MEETYVIKTVLSENRIRQEQKGSEIIKELKIIRYILEDRAEENIGRNEELR